MKSVLKTTPVPPYDLLGLERWLEEQANQGLLPELSLIHISEPTRPY